MTVRAKFRLNKITEYEGGSKELSFGVVYSSDPHHENKAFTDATPSGTVSISIAAGKPALAAFTIGKEYYVDFTQAE